MRSRRIRLNLRREYSPYSPFYSFQFLPRLNPVRIRTPHYASMHALLRLEKDDIQG
jgi:hypothetical protein